MATLRNKWRLLQHPAIRAGAILALIVAIAMMKATYSGITFSFLYQVPIALGVLWFNWKKGLFVAFVCSALSWFMGIQMGIRDPALVHMDTILRFLVFSGFVMLLQGFRWELERQMRLAETDPHTGLLNIRGFFTKAEPLLEEAVEKQTTVSLVYFDLDNFKLVNDTLGHLSGDEVLKMVAVTMKTNFRSHDLICRFGGDEFLAFVPDASPSVIEERAKEFHRQLNGRMQAEKWPVTFSIGCVTYLAPPNSLELVIRGADKLVCEVKQTGKNQLKCCIQ